MPKSFAEHLCHARGGRIGGRLSKHLLRAAFGMEIPEDDESTRGDYSDLADATHFSPKGRAYAEGGEVEKDPSDFPHKEHELPDAEPPWYEGETAKEEHAARRAAGEKDDEESTPAAVASRMALGGLAKKPALGSGARFAHLTHQLEGRGDVKDPKALAAAIGRKKFGAEKMAKLAHHASGGEVERPSFAAHMARRMRLRSAMGGR